MAIRFDITGDNRNFISSMEQVQSAVQHTSKLLGQIGGNFNIDGVVNQVAALSTAIRDNEVAITRQKELIAQWQQQALEARDAGDLSTFNTIQLDITDKLNDMKNLVQETDEYKESLHEILDMTKMFTADRPPMLFTSQAEYDNVQQLKAEIVDLQSQISALNRSGGDTTQLNAQLTQLQDELRGTEVHAAEAAAKLGDAGGMAAATSTRYYELTASVKQQTQSVMELSVKARQAAEELRKATESGNSQAIDDARAKYDAFSDSLTNAKLKLIEMQTEQRHFQEKMQQMAQGTESEGSQMIGIFKNIAAVAGVSFGLNQAKEFVQKVVDVRQYFQDIESSMKVFLGTAEASEKFTQELKDAAYYNMFEFSDLAKASQQMIAYGNDVDSIIPRIQQLSDIAVGTNGSLMELVDAYNRAKSTGVVDARGIQSWAVKGVVIKDILKEMGETAVGTSITFEQLNKVIDHVTGEGGMFHNLQQEMMNNISAEIGQFQDNFDLALNEIGEKYQDVIVGVIKTGSELVDNYEELGRFIMDAVAAYGAYKVALMTTNVLETASLVWKNRHLAATSAEIIAINADTASKTANANATKILTAAQKIFNATVLKNPYALAGIAIAALTFSIYKLVTAEDAETAARRRANEQMDDFKKKLDEQKNRINGYIQTIQDSNATAYEQAVAFESLKQEAPSLAEKYDQAALASMDLSEAQKEVNEEMEKAKFEKLGKKLKDTAKLEAELTKASQSIFSAISRDTNSYLVNKYGKYNVGLHFGQRVKDELAEIMTTREEYEKMKRIQDEVAENARPIEIRVKEAEGNANEKQRIFDFYDKAITLAHEVESATNNADYSDARKNFDDYLAGLEKDVAGIKEKVENNPVVVKLSPEKEAKLRIYNQLVDMKNSWMGVFKSPISVKFQLSFQEAKNAVQDVVSNQLGGKHWNFNAVTGEWSLVDDKPTPTFTEGFKSIQKNFTDTQKALKTIQSNAKKGIETYVTGTGETLKIVTKGAEGARKASQTDYDTIKQRADVASQAYKNAGGDASGKEAKARAKEAKKRAKEEADRRAKQTAEELKRQDELDELKRKGEEARTEASVARIADDGERERAERKAQHDKTVSDLNRQASDIYKAIYEQRKKAYETANKDAHYENTDLGKGGWRAIEKAGLDSLSEDERDYFDTRYAVIKAGLDKEGTEWERYFRDLKREQSQAMIDFRKQWGDYEQQRAAITADYEEKIRRAQTPSAQASLALQRDRELKDLERTHLEETIDWNGIFSDLQGHTAEYLQGLAEQLRKVIREGVLPPDQLQVAQEKLREINAELSKQGGLLDFTGDRKRERMQREQEAADAQANLRQAEMEEAAANRDVSVAKNVIRSTYSLDESQELNDTLLDQFEEGSDEYKRMAALLKTLYVAEGKLADARKESKKATEQAKKAEDASKRDSATAVAEWFEDAQQFITDKGIDQIPGLLDSVGLGGASEAASKGLSAFSNAAGAAADFASGNYVGAAMKALQATFDIGDMLGIGGSSDKTLEEDIERLTASNEALKFSIDELTDEMSKGSTADALKTYDQIREDINASIRNTREMMTRSAAAYDSGKLGLFGGKHSSGAVIDDKVTVAQWVRVSNIVGRSVNSANSFFNLTSEQMYKVAKQAPEIYSLIKGLADDGYKDAAQFMDDYIGYWKQLEDAESKYFEKMSSTSFDSVRDDFTSMLSDLDSKASDFSENFEKYLQQAIINAMVSDNYEEPLKEWYKAFSKAMEGGMTQAETDALKERWDDIVAQGISQRNALRDAFGWTSTSDEGSGSFKNAGSFTYDQANELNGRFAALQIAGEKSNSLIAMAVHELQALSVVTGGSNGTLTEMRNIMLSSNSHLEDIARYTKQMTAFSEKLDRLVANTDRL